MMNVYYTCPFVPRELIAACGLSPCRVIPASQTGCRIEGMCSFTAAWLEFLEQKTGSGESFISIFTSACDQMRRAYDLFSMRCPQNTFLLNVPATTTEHALAYYRQELVRLQDYLCACSGNRPDWHGVRPGLQNQTPSELPCKTRIKIAITGGPVAQPILESVCAMLDACNARIVLNATENTLSPHSFHTASEDADPLATLARAYFDVPAIWRRPNTAFYEWFAPLARKHEIDGVILFRHNCCDLWHSQTQQLHQHASLPVLELDLDGKAAMPQSAFSRLEAFIEALA